jgi:hypothetical protein
VKASYTIAVVMRKYVVNCEKGKEVVANDEE